MEILLLGRRENFHSRIHLEHVMKPARVVTMAVREDDKIESGQVHAKRRHVGGKIIEASASVEEDTLAAVFNEICAQCLQHKMPDGSIRHVFSCFNQDQALDRVDWQGLNDRLRQNSIQENLTARWIRRCRSTA